MKDNLLVSLPSLRLPLDYPWRVRFVAAVEAELKRLRASGRFVPPRFFGYYFRAGRPVGVSGPWTVALESNTCAMQLLDTIGELTHGEFSISSATGGGEPDYLLIHDRLDGECWLWGFRPGLRFVEATEPVEAGADGDGDDRKLLGS